MVHHQSRKNKHSTKKQNLNLNGAVRIVAFGMVGRRHACVFECSMNDGYQPLSQLQFKLFTAPVNNECVRRAGVAKWLVVIG